MEKIHRIDQNTVIKEFVAQDGGNYITYNDNRHIVIGRDPSEMSWQDLLEMALEKTPHPRMVSIEAEIVRIAERKGHTPEERGKWLGLKRTTYVEKLKRVNKSTALSLVED